RRDDRALLLDRVDAAVPAVPPGANRSDRRSVRPRPRHRPRSVRVQPGPTDARVLASPGHVSATLAAAAARRAAAVRVRALSAVRRLLAAPACSPRTGPAASGRR